jgi:hypothetical protein
MSDVEKMIWATTFAEELGRASVSRELRAGYAAEAAATAVDRFRTLKASELGERAGDALIAVRGR